MTTVHNDQSLQPAGLLYLRERLTTDVSPEPTEPAILQIQGNGNDLEEEGGDTLTICCLMSWILRSQRATTTVELDTTTTATVATTATAMAARTVTMTATATAATLSANNGQDGCCDGCCDSTAKVRPPEGLKGQTAQEEETEGYWWWWYYGHWQLRRHLCSLLVQSL